MAQQTFTESALKQSENIKNITSSLTSQLKDVEQKFSDDKDVNNSTIFVSVINYRDMEGQFTLNDLFEKAKNPKRVFVGYCLQYDAVSDSPDINYHFSKLVQSSLGSNIRTLYVPYTQAKGPIYARYLVQKKLFNDEKFYMQIDCHMRFVQNWDEILIKMYNECEDKKAILTNYPNPYDDQYLSLLSNFKQIKDWNGSQMVDTKLLDNHPSILCANKFGDDGFLRVTGKKLCVYPQKPIPSLFIAAGFNFSRSTVIKDCPQDPKLKCLFFGEETTYSARLYTAGYNFYSPTRAVCYHLWKRKDFLRKGIWRELFEIDQLKKQLNALEHDSKINALKLLNGDNVNNNIYGLGKERTLEQYQKFCGIDFKNKTISELSKFGGIEQSKRETMFEEFQPDKIMNLISSFQTK